LSQALSHFRRLIRCPAELLVHQAIRDGARIELWFLDGERMTAKPLAIGQFSFGVRTAEGEEAIMTYEQGYCAKCKKHDLLTPLYGDNGGPLMCLICVGKWHAEHGRRRKAGRVVVRAIKAFQEAGGSWEDVDKLKISTLDGFLGPHLTLDLLGYMKDAINTDGEITDLTSELLDDAIRLTHPDCHPPERQELAKRVTQQLLALMPFTFPAPAPKPASPTVTEPRNSSLKEPAAHLKEQLQPSYPCADCKSTIPYFYCTA
jgi:hypothetical protein